MSLLLFPAANHEQLLQTARGPQMLQAENGALQFPVAFGRLLIQAVKCKLRLRADIMSLPLQSSGESFTTITMAPLLLQTISLPLQPAHE